MFAHIGRVDNLPRYGAPLWMAAEPVEKHRNAHLITLWGYFIGLPVESVLRVALRSPHAMEFKQVRGTLRALSGQFSLAAVEEGTEVRYRLEADPGIAMITDAAARQFLVQFVERMLDRIRLAAERKAPARRVERVDAVGAPGPEAEEDDAEPLSDEAAAAVLPGGEAAVLPVEAAPASEPESVQGMPGAITSAPHRGAQAAPARTGRRRRRRRHRGRPRQGGASSARS